MATRAMTYNALPVGTSYSFDIKAANIARSVRQIRSGAADIVDHFDVTGAKTWVGGDIGDWASARTGGWNGPGRDGQRRDEFDRRPDRPTTSTPSRQAAGLF